MKFIKVTDFVYRGNRPENFKELHAKCVKHVLSLQSGFEDKVSDSIYEFECAVAERLFGIKLYRIKCSNILPPTNEQIEEAIKIIKMAIDLKETIFVHCHSGVDRTGIIMAVVLMIIEKMPYKKAVKNFIDNGRHWWFWWWKFTLKKYDQNEIR